MKRQRPGKLERQAAQAMAGIDDLQRRLEADRAAYAALTDQERAAVDLKRREAEKANALTLQEYKNNQLRQGLAESPSGGGFIPMDAAKREQETLWQLWTTQALWDYEQRQAELRKLNRIDKSALNKKNKGEARLAQMQPVFDLIMAALEHLSGRSQIERGYHALIERCWPGEPPSREQRIALNERRDLAKVPNTDQIDSIVRGCDATLTVADTERIKVNLQTLLTDFVTKTHDKPNL